MDTLHIQNYDKWMEDVIQQHKEAGEVPTLLLHSCCAPCSTAVLDRLAEFFEITIYYYNPNIEPEAEFEKRYREVEQLIAALSTKNPIHVIKGHYDAQEFHTAIAGLEATGERGLRCYECYRLRLQKSAGVAADQKFDYFTTTLSVSPYKNAKWLNEIGAAVAEEFGVAYLFSDFKKKNGYQRSVELSNEYGLYRQDYCGCIYSRQEREQQKSKQRT
jgi:hypothetical protein